MSDRREYSRALVDEIRIDKNRCAGLGICKSLAPEVLEVDAKGVVSLRGRALFPDADPALGRVGEAVEICPLQALELTVKPTFRR